MESIYFYKKVAYIFGIKGKSGVAARYSAVKYNPHCHNFFEKKIKMLVLNNKNKHVNNTKYVCFKNFQ